MIDILIITEDTGHSGVRTFEGLLRRVLRFYDGHMPAVRVHPGEESDAQSAACSVWRSQNPRLYQKTLELNRRVATALKQGRVVLFHTDADITWSRRNEKVPKLQNDFDTIIRNRVKGHLISSGSSPAEADRLLTRLLHVVPTWSVEAWTYQAHEKALELCAKRCRPGCTCSSDFTAWAANRSMLDEVEKPKERCCLSNAHNSELALKLPAEDVRNANKSFASFLKQLFDVDLLQPLMLLSME